MPSPTSASPAFTVKANGSPLSDTVKSQLLELLVDQRIGAPALFRLTFHDPELKVLEDRNFWVGNEITIDVAVDPTRKDVLIEGEITTVTFEDDAWGTHAIVEGMDRSHRLFNNRVPRTFLNATFSDVVTKVAQEAALSVRAGSTRTVHPYVVQNGQSDWELISGLAREIGFDVWMDGKTLRFDEPITASAAPAVEVKRQHNLVHLTAVMAGAGQPGTVESRGWDVKNKQAVVASAQTSTAGGVAGGMGTPTRVRGAFHKGTAGITRRPHRTVSEAEAANKAAAAEVASAFVELHGAMFGDPRVQPRGAVKVAESGQKLNGEYVVTHARHRWDPETGYLTEFDVTGHHDRSLLALSGGAAVPAAAQGRIDGVVIGIVTNVKDEENLGRVKLKFPWWSADKESDWARVAQVLAGSGYGSLFMPEVNDEVLVAFEHGDASRPYVIGKLYNGQQKPAETSANLVGSNGKVTSQRLESRTHHRLVFFDEPNQQQGVTLRTGDDKFFVDLDKTNTKITVSSDGNVEIQATKGTVQIDAKDMKVKTTGSMTVESTGAATYKSDSSMKIESGGTLDIKATGPVQVKGAVIKLN